ncbi:MAG: sulfate ABC transporter permease subunit CysT [Planctomycetia bacterium]|nr:sulfate ABC transporter permease subunit CysT [Planctomycetia bacterium]
MSRRVLPGFGASLGFTLTYLGVLLIIPLIACLIKVSSLTAGEFWAAVWTERTRAAYSFTFTASLLSAVASVVLGMLVAWVLVRYEFFGKQVIDSLIDLPFALPTAVAGLVYSSLYVEKGWLGQYLVPLGIKAAYTPLAVVVVLTFIGLPFVVRAIQPVLETIDADTEEAAHLLGATRWQTFYRIILPTLLPAATTGFALSFARALGEYGSVVFVSGNLPFQTEIAPVLIVARLEQAKYAEATAIAVMLLAISFAMLVLINLLERWNNRHAN